MKLLYIVIAILMLGIIIFLHELGHFIVGRLSGISVTEFALGMGPRICGFTRKGTKFSLRLIPLGGYCAFVGEDEDSSDPRSMNNAPAWKRLLTVLAGPFMNFLVAFILSTILIAADLISNPFETVTYPQVADIIAGMPAEEAGIQKGDVFVEVNGAAISFDGEGTDLLRSVAAACENGESMNVKLDRPVTETEWETYETVLTPAFDEESGSMLMGVQLPVWNAPYNVGVVGAMGESFRFMGRVVVETWKMLVSLISDLVRGNQIEEGAVSGVVGIVDTVSDELNTGFSRDFAYGIASVVYYIMAISLSLGIMNLLPFPALDGGRGVLLVIEAVTGKHIKRETEAVINLIGFAILILLMVFVTVNDVRNIIK